MSRFTIKDNEDFKERFKLLTKKSDRYEFYATISFKDSLSLVGFRSEDAWETFSSTYLEFLAQKGFKSFHEQMNKNYSSFGVKKTGDLGLFMRTCTEAKLKEFLGHKQDTVKGVTPKITSSYVSSCCGMNSYRISNIEPFRKRGSAGLLKKVLKTSAHFKTKNYTASGYIFVIPNDLFTLYSSIFKELEWEFVCTGPNETVLCKKVYSKMTQNWWNGKYPKFLKKKWGKATTTKTASPAASIISGSSDITFYYNFSFPRSPDSFRRATSPIDILILRNVGDSFTDQVYVNMANCIAAGFKPMLKEVAYLNSAHENSERWLVPMYRMNPHFEEDR